jgi:hypothetical protein
MSSSLSAVMRSTASRWQLSFHQLPDAVNIALLEVLHQHLFHFQVVLSHCIGLFAGLEAYRIA